MLFCPCQLLPALAFWRLPYGGLGKWPVASRSSKFLVTGNPVRSDLVAKASTGVDEAKEAIGAAAGQKVLVVIGGSLGSAAINGAMKGAAPPRLVLTALAPSLL